MISHIRTILLSSIATAFLFLASGLPAVHAGDLDQSGMLAEARRAVENEAVQQALTRQHVDTESFKAAAFIEDGSETGTTYTFTGQVRFSRTRGTNWYAPSPDPLYFQATYSKEGRAVLGLRLLEHSPREEAEKSRASSWW